MKDLINKYNVAGPRYTSYPTVPYWNGESFSAESYIDTLKRSYRESNSEGISIYIHLPYCESLCTFCGCHKKITRNHDVEKPYIDALLKEWDLYSELFANPPIIKELHLGGGTPTFFSPENLRRLIVGIQKTSDTHPEAEFSFEGHPNNTTREHSQTLFDLGFKRISFGVQDYSPQVQTIINRIQPFEKVQEAHETAKSIGYLSVNHDLVFGLPKQTKADIEETMRLTNLLRPERISLYSYAHVPWIRGIGQRRFDERDLPSPELKRELYESAKMTLTENGYHEIGMDHFALSSDSLYEAFMQKKLHRNFMGYTTNTTQLMIGLGMSSISDSWYGFAQNAKNVNEYLKFIDEGVIPIFRGHLLSEEDLMIRRHILDLMCAFETQWSDEFKNNRHYPAVLEQLAPLAEDGLVVIEENGLRVTETGKVFIRNICMCFDLYLHQKDTQEKPLFSKTI